MICSVYRTHKEVITIDPQQELFTALLLALREQFGDANVFDSALPPEGTPYPFVYLADSQLNDQYLKNAVFGTVDQTIHVWGNDPKKRGTISAMLLQIKQICRELSRTDNFGWMLVDVNQQILPDTTTNEPLIHGWLQVSFRFS